MLSKQKGIVYFSSVLVLLCANNNIQALLYYHVTYLLFNASIDTFTISVYDFNQSIFALWHNFTRIN